MTLTPTGDHRNIPLSQGELFVLVLGARMPEAFAGSVYSSYLKSAVEQLRQRLPDKSWFDLDTLTKERILFQNSVETILDPDIWVQLEPACQ